jgi:heat shock protein HtpX
MGLAFAVVMNFSTYFFSDKIALATYSAQLVTPEQNPDIYRRVAPIVENLTRRMNLPMPKLYVIAEPSPNAFATGRNPSHASVAFTSGILDLMTDQELDGVIAHELGHVLHRDILISSIAATLAGAIMFASRLGFFFGGSDDRDREGGAVGAILMMILAPIAALLIQMAISRSREYEADAASAKYTGTPHELISGLQKLETWSKRLPMQATPSTAHMFIIEPASRSWLRNLWSTHPSTADRIRRLQEIR